LPDGQNSPRLWQTPSNPTFTKRRQVRQTERAELLLPAEAHAMMGNPKLRLNPRFVEWLMGFPIGYTDLKP